MFEILFEYIERKDFKRYAWALYSAYADGTVRMKELFDLYTTFYQKEIDVCIEDSDTWEYITMDSVYDYCAFFVFALLKKGLFDGRWTYENGIFTSGDQTQSLEEIEQFVEALNKKAGEAAEYVSDWLKEMDRFDADEEAFWLAPLDHCTEKTALVVLGIMFEIFDSRWSSLERLKEKQYIWPERFLLDDLVEEIAKHTYQSYCYFFLEQANEDEQAEANTADYMIKEARTIAEAVFAAEEYAFWLQIESLFPYSAYMYLTGQLEDQKFAEKVEDLIDFTQDPTLTAEGYRIMEQAIAGDPTAQDTLSQMYVAGKNVAKNEYRAVYWMKKAADQGVANAQCNYGVALQQRMGGLDSTYAEAIPWFLAAAEQDHDMAQYNLGLAYATGKGVPRDKEEADKWFRKAADNGNVMAKLILEHGLIINN